MLSAYILTVDITSVNASISEEIFREQIGQSLNHLDYLKGAFDRSPCTVTYYPPSEQHDRLYWSARGVVMISIGKKRAEFLLQLYQSISKLIELELSHFQVECSAGEFQFS